MFAPFRALWAYRGFVLGSVSREFHARYANSMLGTLWTVLNPLAQVVVYTVIFSQVMRARLPGIDSAFAYSIYLCAGVIAWGFFSDLVSRLQVVFIQSSNLLKKLSFPRSCLPTIVLIGAAIDYAIITALFVLFLIVTGNFPGIVILGLVPVLAVQVAFGLGLGVTLGVLNVFFRDIGQFVGIVLQFWFWFTPIVYPASILPPSFRPLVEMNPMAGVVAAHQRIFLEGQWPHWEALVPAGIAAVVACALALLVFRRLSAEMVDEF